MIALQFWDLQEGEARGYAGESLDAKIADATFSCDNNYVLSKHENRTTIWDFDSKRIVFDSNETSPQKMSLQKAKDVIQSCGPKAHQLWPFSFDTRDTTDNLPAGSSIELNVSNIHNFIPYDMYVSSTQYCHGTLVMNVNGLY